MVSRRRGFRRFRRGFKKYGRRRGYRGKVRRAKRFVRKALKRARSRKLRAFRRKMCPPKLVRLRTIGFPHSMVTDCEFRSCTLCDPINQTGPLTCSMGNGYKVNSIYDPNVDVTGTFNASSTKYHRLYEQYEKYEVIACKGVFTLRQYAMANLDEGDTHNPIKWGVSLDNNNTLTGLASAWTQLVQRPSTKTRTFMPTNQIGMKGVNVQTIKMYWTKKGGIYDDKSTTGASFASDPTDVEYWRPWWAMLQDQAGYASNPYCNLEVYMRFTVRFSNPKDMEGMTTRTHQY